MIHLTIPLTGYQMSGFKLYRTSRDKDLCSVSDKIVRMAVLLTAGFVDSYLFHTQGRRGNVEPGLYGWFT